MKTALFPLLLLFVAFSLSGCKKGNVTPEDPMGYLYKRSWKRATTDKNPGRDVLLNIYHLPSDCEKDDVYTFFPDGTLKIDNGTQQCVATESRIETGTYHVDKAEITIKGVKYVLTEVTPQQIKYAWIATNGTLNVILLQ